MRQLPANSAKWVDILDSAFRYARPLLAAIIIITALTAVFLSKSPRRYRSEALLLVKNERVQTTISPSETGHAVASPVTENDIRTEVELLQSRGLLAAAAAASGMYPQDATPADGERVLDDISRSLRINPVLKADMIRVEYTSRDPRQGVTFLKHMLKVHLDRHIDLHSRGKVDLFEKESRRLEQELRDKERELSRFQQANDIHVLADQKVLLLHKAAEAQTALRQSELKLADNGRRAEELQSTVSNMPARVVTVRRRMPNQYSVERLQTMLVELENRGVELRSKYLDEDRLVRQNAEQIQVTRAALAEARRQTSDEESTDLNSNRIGLEGELLRARVEATSASAQTSVLARQLDGYRKELARLESLVAEHDHLTRQVREIAERRQLHLRKSEESRIEAALDARRVTNVVVAQPPLAPARPEPRPYLAALGLWIIGVTLSAGAIFLYAASRGLIYSAAGLQRATGIPVLASVPLERKGDTQ